MKSRFLLLLPLLAATTPASRAAIVYNGVQDFPIPFDLEGSYLRIDTGATAGTLPGDWATAPWINPYFGGVKVANSPLLRPVITGSTQILNLAVGTVIDGTSNFVAGESGSETHFGLGAGQFALNVPGYMGVTFRPTVGGPDYYGWIELQVSNLGPGKIISWAYESVSDEPIQVGAVPEPGVLGLQCAGLGVLGWRRNRKARLRAEPNLL
jgi:hypothetical protein